MVQRRDVGRSRQRVNVEHTLSVPVAGSFSKYKKKKRKKEKKRKKKKEKEKQEEERKKEKREEGFEDSAGEREETAYDPTRRPFRIFTLFLLFHSISSSLSCLSPPSPPPPPPPTPFFPPPPPPPPHTHTQIFPKKDAPGSHWEQLRMVNAPVVCVVLGNGHVLLQLVDPADVL